MVWSTATSLFFKKASFPKSKQISTLKYPVLHTFTFLLPTDISQMVYMFQQTATRTSIGHSILYLYCCSTFPEKIKKKSTRIASITNQKPPKSQQYHTNQLLGSIDLFHEHIFALFNFSFLYQPPD